MTKRYTLRQQSFVLHPYKAIFWEEKAMLLLADLHLGKVNHFQRNGFPVPQGASHENWDKLYSLLLQFQPKEVVFLGDLFHSDYNKIWEELCQFIEQWKNIKFTLVVGNHDILDEDKYATSGMTLHDALTIPPFLFTHHPQEEIPASLYNLAGHIHPAVRLRGNGRQYLRLACFYFGAQQGILPAFGAFTGMATLQIKAEDEVFVIAEDEVIAVT